jgi:hypothetical protein
MKRKKNVDFNDFLLSSGKQIKYNLIWISNVSNDDLYPYHKKEKAWYDNSGGAESNLLQGVTEDAPADPGGGTEPDQGSGKSASGGRGRI